MWRPVQNGSLSLVHLDLRRSSQMIPEARGGGTGVVASEIEVEVEEASDTRGTDASTCVLLQVREPHVRARVSPEMTACLLWR